MGQTRTIIESTGSHHNGIPQDADKVARDTVATLQAMGHTVTKAEFQVRSFGADGEVEPSSVDNLLPEPVAVAAVETGASDLGAGAGAAADSEAGTGDKPE